MYTRLKKGAFATDWEHLEKIFFNSKGLILGEFDGKNFLFTNLETGELFLVENPSLEEIKEIRRNPHISFSN